jgi:hypothetical protein
LQRIGVDMTKEALKLALEALEVANSCADGYYIPKGKTHLPEIELAITAIKEALAQPEQDGECKYCTDGCPACDARKLPEQDWIEQERAVGYREGHMAALSQRTWVGLEREIATAVLEHCYSPMAVTSDMIERTTEVIKAKLKEKNT